LALFVLFFDTVENGVWPQKIPTLFDTVKHGVGTIFFLVLESKHGGERCRGVVGMKANTVENGAGVVVFMYQKELS